LEKRIGRLLHDLAVDETSLLDRGDDAAIEKEEFVRIGRDQTGASLLGNRSRGRQGDDEKG
jgi:hypothetical protein